jgi:hypothetical protein
VTAPVARSVIERELVFETLKERFIDCPAKMFVFEAEKSLMAASWATEIVTSLVTLPAPLATVSL